MFGTSILTRQDERRPSAEALITDMFKMRYSAQVSVFPETLIATFNDDKQAICAAGLRFSRDGFFSEQYLNDPIELVLSSAFGLQVKRDELLEVTSLASRDVRQTIKFVRAIISYGQRSGYGWAFFTLTTRVARMLAPLGIDLVPLARAEPHRVARSADWGSYYSCAPYVFAFRNPAHSAISFPSKESIHALPL
ncbi:thermostable hemolysin [Rhizobium sp. P40RR-XXII]|uniref:thermostable hemolysin n=1 Tax=Rhizobium sp. P40RR-XXII TaxID=2726739 RepID=UPI001456FE39